MTRALAFAAAACALASGLTACSKPEVKEGDANAVAPSTSVPATAAVPDDPRIGIADTARIMGNPAAKVWLVEASDFQCPACKLWHDQYSAEIMRDYIATGKVRFAYINFPLDGRHPNARAAAEAGMCAAAQGKFWGFHDHMFERQDDWGPVPDPIPLFRQIATQSGVDTVAWNKCLVDDVMVPVVEADHARGRAGGVDQTPYFFIGSLKVGGAIPPKNLRQLLDSALALAGGTSK